MEESKQHDMEEFNELDDAIQIIGLKNLLIIAGEVDLVTDFAAPEDYAWFIDTLNIALTNEPAFFLLDDKFLTSAEEVLYSKRYEYRNLEEYNDVINEIIESINDLKSLSDYEKARRAYNYVAWNIAIRKLSNSLSIEDLYKTIAYDAVVLESTKEGEIPEISTELFAASTNFIVETIPEFYDEYPLAKETTMSFLKQESHKKQPWKYKDKSSAKKSLKILQKIKEKEE